MKIILLAVWLFVMAGSGAAETSSVSVVRGQLQSDVMNKLGEPAGEMQKGSRTIWLYPRGTVEFEGGRVVRSDLMSDQAYSEEQARRAQRVEAPPPAPVPAAPTKPDSALPPKPKPRAAGKEPLSGDTSARFTRPFVRPTYEGAPCYNNIPVVFEIAKWPPAMRQDYDTSVEIPVETGQRRTTYDTLVYELMKYPDEMLEQTLRCIYMIRNIQGTGEGKDPHGLSFYTEGIILEHTSILHHEYAHQLNALFHGAFPAKQLTEVSGDYSGFRPDRKLYYKDLWKLGYTSNYAMTTVKEDFAEFCSELYLQPIRLFAAMKENPKLEDKFNVVRPFLEMVKRRTTGDGAPMDEAYFSRFDRTQWKP